MKKVLFSTAAVVLLGGTIAFAQAPGYWGQGPGWGGGMGLGMMGGGWGQGMGPGMMRGYGPCENSAYGATEGVTLEKASEIAAQYTEKYLKGFTVERVLPFTGMRHTMYTAELKGPNGEIRTLRINPWGGVMPFAGGPYAGR